MEGHFSKNNFLPIGIIFANSVPAFCRERELDLSFRDPKAERLCELLDAKPGERWLIFTEFKQTAKYLERKYKDVWCCYLVVKKQLKKKLPFPIYLVLKETLF